MPQIRRRLIIDTDAKNEAADQFAVVHALLTTFAAAMSLERLNSGEELRQKVAPLGELGAYLVQQLLEFNATVPQPIEHRSLGDSPAIGAIMNPAGATWRLRPAPRFTPSGDMEPENPSRKPIRVMESIDTRWLLEDMFAKLRKNAG